MRQPSMQTTALGSVVALNHTYGKDIVDVMHFCHSPHQLEHGMWRDICQCHHNLHPQNQCHCFTP